MDLMNKPYLIDAVIGNSRTLATLTHNAEIQRLFWPHVDGPQHVHRILGGLFVDGHPAVWQDSDQWQHAQAYEPDQNVLITHSLLGTSLLLTTTDAAVPDQDLLVRHLSFGNSGPAPVQLQYVLYQWARIDENPLYNTALFDEGHDALVHYRKETYLALGADRPVATFGTGHPPWLFDCATTRSLDGRVISQGDVAGALLWDLGAVAPGESVTLSLFWAMGPSIYTVRELLAGARKAGAPALLDQTRAYWTEWLSRARPLQIPAAAAGLREPLLPGLPTEAAAPAEIAALYRRSLLVFKLMADEQTGAVIAAPEFDPGYTACGGYAYCWGRDAAYITVAMDLAGYHDLAAGFYRWAVGAQEPEGWWMQRHQVTGHWAPSWGLIQVDETGSILYGMALHARIHGGAPFVQTVWESVARAADWLVGYMDLSTGLTQPSVDLWEERTAALTYSCGAVWAGLTAAAQMATLIGHGAHAARYQVAAAQLKEAILRESVAEGRFVRGRFPEEGPAWAVETVPDSSLLGMATPFGLVDHADPVMVSTADHLVNSLWTEPAGGMRRYVGDHYRGGNPWILCTLWLGLYDAERGDTERARQILDWAVARRTGTGLLAEQVDPVTGEAVWVVPLTWSHAMYVLLALKLYQA